MPDIPAFRDAERLDRPDLELVGLSAASAVRQMAAAFLTDADPVTNPSGSKWFGRQAWILGGFDITNPNLMNVRVDRGTAILNTKEKGQVVVGCVTNEGTTPIIIDLSTFANATYGVYLRFEYQEAATANRVFWNALSSVEYTQNVPTRLQAAWNVQIAAVSPGADWLKIGEVVVTNPTITITKMRQFYFEGDENDGYATGWGSGNDRNANRALYGVHDLHSFSAAVFQKLAEIQGQDWWEITTEPLNEKMSKHGDTAAGTYTFNNSSPSDYVELATTNVVLTGDFVTVNGQLDLFGPSKIHDYPLLAAANEDLGNSTTGRWGTLYGTDLNVKYPASGTLHGLSMTHATDANRFMAFVDALGVASLMTGNTFTQWSLDFHSSAYVMAFHKTLTSAYLDVTGDILPSADNGASLGSGSNRWQSIYGSTGVLGGNTITAASIIPASNATTLGDHTDVNKILAGLSARGLNLEVTNQGTYPTQFMRAYNVGSAGARQGHLGFWDWSGGVWVQAYGTLQLDVSKPGNPGMLYVKGGLTAGIDDDGNAADSLFWGDVLLERDQAKLKILDGHLDLTEDTDSGSSSGVAWLRRNTDGNYFRFDADDSAIGAGAGGHALVTSSLPATSTKALIKIRYKDGPGGSMQEGFLMIVGV